jgi:hypothetical protein
MFEIDKVLEAKASYEQIDPSRWRASITGIVKAAVVADTPFRCQLRLKWAVDFVLSRAVLGVGPFSYEKDGTTASLSPELEKLLSPPVANVADSAEAQNQPTATSSKLVRKARKTRDL